MSTTHVPRAAYSDTHTAVLGKTGSGKTSTAKTMVEQLAAAGGRVCILDPIKSDWWGLKSDASGKGAGLPFVILGTLTLALVLRRRLAVAFQLAANQAYLALGGHYRPPGRMRIA
jgi:DNA helicase HerA-like ATPase